MADPMCDRPVVEIGPHRSKRICIQSQVWPWVRSRYIGYDKRWAYQTLFTLERQGTAYEPDVWRQWECPQEWHLQWRAAAGGASVPGGPGAGPGGGGGASGLGPVISGAREPGPAGGGSGICGPSGSGGGACDVPADVGGLVSGFAPGVTGATDGGGVPRPVPTVGAGNSESGESEADAEVIDAIFAEALDVGVHSE